MTTGHDDSGTRLVPAERSGLVRVFAGLAWLTLAYVAVVTIGPVSWRPDFGHMNVERFIGFGVLSFLFVMGYPRHRLLIVSMLFGGVIGLELLQLVVPGRDASLFNVLVKLGGCAVGTAAGGALIWLLDHTRLAPIGK